jgi:hypothetical protein
MNLSFKQKIIGAAIGIGLILIVLFKFGFGGNPIPVINNNPNPSEQNSSNPALISSEPPELYIKKPLIISPSQVLKLNFSVPLQNGPETKIVLDPPADVQIELTNDNKTAVITPKAPYKLGQGYAIFIKRDTKLKEEGKVLGQDYDLHFNVINYSGI